MSIEVVRKDDVAWLTLDYGSGNSMTREFMRDLNAALDEASRSNALVITGRGLSFSVGLDLPALLGLARDEVGSFINEFSTVMQRVFLWPKPTVAAINGHAVAGGFILAAACDFRVTLDGPAKLGMTGVSLGIAYPALVTSVLQYMLPQSTWHSVLLEGRLFTVQEALERRLIDRTTAVLDDVTQMLALKLASADSRAYERTKRTLKVPRLADNDDSHAAFVESLFHPETRARLEATVLRLKNR